ncbi:Inosine/xanthosine triphosphatase [Cladobotryum mycophilum]|uniref:inosine/xanthosine triphosphatase n=1 Tax=Cladobotryum mycophilum TaxID=491253 RepID=A0ABR0T397_9HYPO
MDQNLEERLNHRLDDRPDLKLLAFHSSVLPAPSKVVIISSKNPVKIRAAQHGFTRMFPIHTFDFRNVSVPSGVSEQPMSDDETLDGAVNRAHNARELEPNADYWIGLEGAAASTAARSSRLPGLLFWPEEVAELVRAGMQLGEADDLVFERKNSRQFNGSIGLLTGNVMDRASSYAEAVLLALIPFNNPKLTFPE